MNKSQTGPKPTGDWPNTLATRIVVALFWLALIATLAGGLIYSTKTFADTTPMTRAGGRTR